MRVDLHTHTEFSCDADINQSPLDKARAAKAKGIDILALTDHLDFYRQKPPAENRDPAACVAAARQVQREMAGEIEVLCGMEFGQPHADPAAAEDFLSHHPLDVVIGSVHAMPNDVDAYFTDFTALDCDAYLKDYCDELLKLMRWGKFHILAHIDYPLRVMRHGDYIPSYDHCMDRIERVLRACIDGGFALELNAAGLGGWMKKVGPPQHILYEYRRMGGTRISVGSDAHTLAALGRGFKESVQKARQAGFAEVTVFRAGKAHAVPLG